MPLCLCTIVHMIRFNELRMRSQQSQVKLQKTWRQICRRRWRVGVFEDEEEQNEEGI